MSRFAMRLLVLVFVGSVVLTASVASAQTTTAVPSDNQQVVSANPFLMMFSVFNVEYERKHKASTTWGASTSMVGFDDATYKNVAGFYRYYPGGNALSGFFVGGRGGVYRVSFERESAVAYGLGFELGYNWLLGAEKNFSVGLGAGATRLFGGDLDGVSLTYPTFRVVNIGWSF
jgi:Protein of unknown function (DUF3575)